MKRRAPGVRSVAGWTMLLFALVCAGVAAAAEVLTIGGSGTNLGAIRHLAQEFTRATGQPTRVLPSIGSGGGIKALLMGDIHLGLTSRALRADELGRGLKQRLYARTPLVFAVPESLPVNGLTREQIYRIYSGELTEWHSGQPIRLVLRPRIDSDTLALTSLLPEMREAVDAAFGRQTVTAYTDQENANMLEQVDGGLGTSSLGQLLSEKRRLKALSLGGVAPTPENLRQGLYPLSKSLYLVLPEEPHPQALRFVEYVVSHGADYLSQTGHLVPAAAD